MPRGSGVRTKLHRPPAILFPVRPCDQLWVPRFGCRQSRGERHDAHLSEVQPVGIPTGTNSHVALHETVAVVATGLDEHVEARRVEDEQAPPEPKQGVGCPAPIPAIHVIAVTDGPS